MSIFTLLGNVIDGIAVDQYEVCLKDDKIVSIIVEDVDIIVNHILPLCVTLVKERYAVIENGEWYFAQLNFGENPCNKRGELQSVTFVNSENDTVTVPVADEILEELLAISKDELYYKMCDEILL